MCVYMLDNSESVFNWHILSTDKLPDHDSADHDSTDHDRTVPGDVH